MYFIYNLAYKCALLEHHYINNQRMQATIKSEYEFRPTYKSDVFGWANQVKNVLALHHDSEFRKPQVPPSSASPHSPTIVCLRVLLSIGPVIPQTGLIPTRLTSFSAFQFLYRSERHPLSPITLPPLLIGLNFVAIGLGSPFDYYLDNFSDQTKRQQINWCPALITFKLLCLFRTMGLQGIF